LIAISINKISFTKIREIISHALKDLQFILFILSDSSRFVARFEENTSAITVSLSIMRLVHGLSEAG